MGSKPVPGLTVERSCNFVPHDISAAYREAKPRANLPGSLLCRGQGRQLANDRPLLRASAITSATVPLSPARIKRLSASLTFVAS